MSTHENMLMRNFPVIIVATGMISLGLFAWFSDPVMDPRTTVSSLSSLSYEAYSFDRKGVERFVRGGGNDYETASKDSLGFFDDVQSHTWDLMKKKVAELRKLPDFPQSDYRNKHPGFYYQYHNEPDFTCPHEMRIGDRGDGGKWICDPHRIAARGTCLVYSVGSRGDFSFEVSVLKEISPDCEIHTFDLDDYTEVADKEFPQGQVKFHHWGLGVETNEHNPKYNIKSLKRTITELGHQGRTIDVFKIDCDNCEWETYQSWFESDVILRQVQVEIHRNPRPQIQNFFRAFRNNGYVMFHKEPNIAHPLNSPVEAIEFSFLKLAESFFEGMISLDLADTE